MLALTWPSLGVLVEHLQVHLPLLLLLLDLGLLVDLLDGLGALVGSPGHPVVLRVKKETGQVRLVITYECCYILNVFNVIE